MDKPVIRITLMIDGKAVQPTPQHTLEFEQGSDTIVVPVLFHKGRKVTKQWLFKADIWMPATQGD